MSGADPSMEVEDTFEQLNRRFRPGLMAFFLRRLGNHAEAEDMTQDVFLRLASVDDGQMQSAEAYIFRMATNLLRDRSRREKVRFNHRASVMDTEGVGIDTLDPLRVAAGRESLADMVAALRELPERARTVFILYRLENVDKRDIARGFGVSLSSVERDLARAMTHLTRRIGRPE